MAKKTMFVKVVEFYPKEMSEDRKKILGSLHIRLPGLGIDIRGILVRRSNDVWFFGMPYSYGMDQNHKIKFPAFCFMEPAQMAEFKNILMKEGKKFIEKRYCTPHDVQSIDAGSAQGKPQTVTQN